MGIRMKEKQQAVRLNKYLAECGVCSRREADKLIDLGKVKVDGFVAAMGTRVTEESAVTVNGKPVQSNTKRVVLAFNKPVGVTCTEKDAHAKITITDYMKYPIRITYAGRLDKDSEGLIIMSNDGDLIQELTKSVNKHEKEYIVKVHKQIEDSFLARMREGIFLKELEVTTRKCEVEKVGPYTFRIILTQGLNRQIRRMCESLGYRVIQLKRVRVMNVELGKLKTGAYRELYGEELEELYRQTRV